MCIWSRHRVVCYKIKKLCSVGLLRGMVDQWWTNINVFMVQVWEGVWTDEMATVKGCLAWQLNMSQQCYALAKNSFSSGKSWQEIWCLRGRITGKISPELLCPFSMYQVLISETISTGWNTSNNIKSLAKAWPVKKSWSIFRGLI